MVWSCPALTVTIRPHMRRKDTTKQMTTKSAFLQHHKTRNSPKLLNSTILTVAVVSLSFSKKKFTICQTHSTLYPISPIVTGKPFKSAVLTLLELEISEPNSPMSRKILTKDNPKALRKGFPYSKPIPVQDCEDTDTTDKLL